MPQVVNIETINRCNSTCEFCTANVNAEKRPRCVIDDGLYRNIIDQLADWGYEGHLTLYGNNEPLLDTKIVERHKYAREKLPKAFIFMNYALEYKLHDNIKELYDYVKAHPDEFKDLDIQIQMRYLKEVLTNRAGSSPNKKETLSEAVTEACLLPFTDVWITPNGKVGLCCCDNYEVTDFGDLNRTPLVEIWNSSKLRAAREKIAQGRIAQGRQNYPFCSKCDFIDAGFRMQVARKVLAGDFEGANRTGGEEKNSRKSRS